MEAAIFISDDLEIFKFNVFPFPGVVISSKDARAVIKYVESNGASSTASMSFQQTFVGTKGAPAVAAYTSKGPAPSFPGILKPDVMAPGTLVLAAWNPTLVTAGIESNLALSSNYYIISGTSMACPHASGIAAILKGAHPKWSFDIATPLAMGAGQVHPNVALDPGLIYDATTQDYATLVPEITKHFQRFERVITNVGAGTATYKAKVAAPLGSRVTVSPDSLVFRKPNEKKVYSMTIQYNGDKNEVDIMAAIGESEEFAAEETASSNFQMGKASPNDSSLNGVDHVKTFDNEGEFDPRAPPPFKIAEIRAAIPQHCWVKDPWKSLSYVIWDVLVVFGLAVVAIYFNNWAVWPLYWAAQGTMFWAIFVLGHDWRISHRMHHQNHGNVEHDEAWAPITEGRYKSLDIKVKILRFKMPFPLFAQPIYLWTGTPGKNRSQFSPYSSLFRPDERMYVITSTICWALMVGLIYYLTKLIGLVEMLKIYGVPLMVSEWSYLRGGLTTVDRDYGMFNSIHHDIGTHVVPSDSPLSPCRSGKDLI
ncbi:hypothetical protein RHGRI_016274 [Rhododendron griersonianum]|uniref:Peptidase S8/S53 domain-containing protein n=1 Tax=Rhododendron griersonianum TaxID=479676 RepID=A0AAV6JTK8_9ERIC|nr:hypothetical protein RHGRI_016274 [Rhododendron griersonianum]